MTEASKSNKPEAREGAPKLETPEKPAEPPEETPRSEEPELETPEEPTEPPVERDLTQVLAPSVPLGPDEAALIAAQHNL